MSLAALETIVVNDSSLQERLLSTSSREEFVALVVAVAAEHSILIEAADIEAALVANRRAHLERWL